MTRSRWRTPARAAGLALMAMALLLPASAFANTNEPIAQTGGMTVTIPMLGTSLTVAVTLDAVGNISDAQRQEFQDAFAKFSACMRQNGVDIPDPGSGSGPPAGGGGQLDQSDPKVQAATKACQDKLPQRGQGGPGGPGGG